jgi:hypothetical protein
MAVLPRINGHCETLHLDLRICELEHFSARLEPKVFHLMQDNNLTQSQNVASAATGQREFSVAAGDCGVRSLKVEEFWQWERLVQQSLQGTLFHSQLWLDALEEPYKLFGWFRGGELRGGLAAGIVGPRKIAIPCPMITPYLGVIFPKSDAKYATRISTEIEIAAAFAKFLRSEFESVYFRFPPEVTDLRPFNLGWLSSWAALHLPSFPE